MMKHITISKKCIGQGNPVYVIAEIGVNHNGDADLAEVMIKAAAKAGADCVKFQTFKADRIVTESSPKAHYQLQTTDPEQSQEHMLKRLELAGGDYERIIETCKNAGVIFLSTPYNVEDVDFLYDIGVSAFKVASGQAVEPYFLEYIAKKGKPVILSTGMCTLAEVFNAVETIRGSGNEQIAVLQCTTNYPSSIDDTNLFAMVTMREALKVVAGYSDHTESLTCATAAVALGAQIVERHFTLDKSFEGPDHSCSSTPEEFSAMVKNIREVERAMGTGLKIPTAREMKNSEVMRRSIVAAIDIPEGTVLTMKNLTLKRPGNGYLGNRLGEFLGKVSRIDICKDTTLNFQMVR